MFWLEARPARHAFAGPLCSSTGEKPTPEWAKTSFNKARLQQCPAVEMLASIVFAVNKAGLDVHLWSCLFTCPFLHDMHLHRQAACISLHPLTFEGNGCLSLNLSLLPFKRGSDLDTRRKTSIISPDMHFFQPESLKLILSAVGQPPTPSPRLSFNFDMPQKWLLPSF